MFKLSAVKDGAIKLFNKSSWEVKKHSPEICLVIGIAGAVAAVVTAIKATPKAEVVVDELKARMENVHAKEDAGKTDDGSEYTHEDAKKDTLTIYIQQGIKLVKAYAPSIIFLGCSIAAQVCGYKTLANRLALAGAAYAALDDKFKAYRGRVSEAVGEEKEKELYSGVKAEEKQVQTGKKDENGNDICESKTVTTADDDDYTAIFDECSSQWVNDNEQNLFNLARWQSYFDNKLKMRNGRPLFLNEVRRELGLPLTQVGQVVGWVYDPKNPNHRGDNCVDFGLGSALKALSNPSLMREIPFDKNYVLNFNVDGSVLYAL